MDADADTLGAQWSAASGNERRFPADALLRANGWEIVARPRGGEPLWMRRGGRRKEFTARQALARVLRKYGWRPRDGGWVHEYGLEATLDEAVASVLAHEATRPKEMRGDAQDDAD